MYTFLVIVQVLIAVALVGLILLQQGKGADAGAAFGSGASGTVFGARGSANFLSRTTAWLAAAFFLISLALAYLVRGHIDTGSVVDQVPAVPAQVPAPTGSPAVPPQASGGKSPAEPSDSKQAGGAKVPEPVKVPE